MINTSESRIIFNGNGTATEFPYSFAIINDTDVKVMTVDPDGVETVLDSDYYVDVTASKVIYPGYPPGEEPAESERPPVLPTGWQLVVYRDIPITQEANLGNVWPFNVIEDALDKITMILQNIYDGFKRSFKVSQSAPADIDIYVPIEANKALKWNADGTQIVLTTDPAEVLPQVQNLLQQTTQQANIATEKANAAAESALAAATSESNAGAHEDKAQAWAESATSPDGKASSKSAKTWASEAANDAETVRQIKEDLQDLHGVTGVATTEQLQSGTDNTTIVTPAGLTTARPMKCYTNSNQIGLNDRTFTWEQLYDALPNNSMLVCSVNPTSASPLYNPNLDLPNAGTLNVVKGSGRGYGMQIILIPSSVSNSLNINWATFADETFSGWKQMATTDMIPVGTILPFAGGTIPSGFLACNGAAVSRTTYSALFSAIGTTYGGGNGSSTFNLPNLENNKFLQGNSTPGTVKAAGLPNITGEFQAQRQNSSALATGAFAFGANAITDSADYAGNRERYTFDASRCSAIYGASTTVQPPAVTVRFIIKY